MLNNNYDKSIAGLCLSSLVVIVAFGVLSFWNFNRVQAQLKQPFSLDFSLSQGESGSVLINITVVENAQPPHGPYVDNWPAFETDNNWHMTGYIYEYIANSRFNCNNVLVDEFASLTSDTARMRWAQNNQITSEWSQQKATFTPKAPTQGWSYKTNDNTWQTLTDTTPPPAFKDNPDRQLAYCLQVKRHDNTDAVVNNVLLNLNDFSQSKVGVEVSHNLPPKTAPPKLMTPEDDDSLENNRSNSTNLSNASSSNPSANTPPKTTIMADNKPPPETTGRTDNGSSDDDTLRLNDQALDKADSNFWFIAILVIGGMAMILMLWLINKKLRK